MRKSLIICLTTLILLWNSIAYACVGARPLGMGGAFIGIADDITTVYWNPAGVISLEPNIYHLTLTISPPVDRMGYRSFWVISSKLEDTIIALSSVERLENIGILEKWYVCSTAIKTNQVSLGVNLRYENHSNNVQRIQLDLGALWKINKNWKIGLLYQSFNNFRVGVSFEPNENLLIGFDIYNALKNPNILNGESRLMYGLEIRDKSFAYRIGAYAGDLTLGLGYKESKFQYDIAVLFRNATILLFSITYNGRK